MLEKLSYSCQLHYQCCSRPLWQALSSRKLFSISQLGLGPARGALIEPPDGNFYGTAGFFAQDSNNIGIDEASFPFSGQWF
jgi:hypothetical protein